MNLFRKKHYLNLLSVLIASAHIWHGSAALASEIIQKMTSQGLIQDRMKIRQNGGDAQELEVFRSFSSFAELAKSVETSLGKDYLIRRYETESYKSLIIADQRQQAEIKLPKAPENLSPAQVAALLQDKVYVISFISTGNGGHTILGSNLKPAVASLGPASSAKPSSDLFASAPFLKECKDRHESEIVVAQTYNASLQCGFPAKQESELKIQIVAWMAKQGYEALQQKQSENSLHSVYKAKNGASVVNVLLNKIADGSLHLIINEGVASSKGQQSQKIQ